MCVGMGLSREDAQGVKMEVTESSGKRQTESKVRSKRAATTTRAAAVTQNQAEHSEGI